MCRITARQLSAPISLTDPGHKSHVELITGQKQHKFARQGRIHKTQVPCNGELRTLLLRTTTDDPSPNASWPLSVILIPEALPVAHVFSSFVSLFFSFFPFRNCLAHLHLQVLHWADSFLLFFDAADRRSFDGTI